MRRLSLFIAFRAFSSGGLSPVREIERSTIGGMEFTEVVAVDGTVPASTSRSDRGSCGFVCGGCGGDIFRAVTVAPPEALTMSMCCTGG